MPFKSFADYCREEKAYILNEWDDTKNGPLPDTLSYQSHRLFWFICSNCGSEFQTSPHSIVSSKYNCCKTCWITRRAEARHKAAYSKLSIALFNDNLLKEYDTDKNSIPPNEVSIDDIKQYWWKCSKCGHEWKASPHNRKRGTGCPRCTKASHTSFPEQAIFYYVKKAFPDAVNQDKSIGVELDIYIPSKKIAIEYDGQAWHQNKEKDKKKNLVCANNGIVLIRVRERECWFWHETPFLKLIPITSGKKEELNSIIYQIMALYLDAWPLFSDEPDVSKDQKEILAQYISSKKNNSLAAKYPEAIKEWDYEKNGNIKPEDIDSNSGKEFWWKCLKCGYKWEASPNARFRKDRIQGCPSCSHKVAWPGHTDIKTLYPDLMEEWDYEENNKIGLNPSLLLPNSDKRAFWICSKCGYKWQTSISNRTSGKGCKKCAINRHKKAVINLDTQQVFDSADAAGEFYGKPKNHHIGDCCKGKREKALGYKWSYHNN